MDRQCGFRAFLPTTGAGVEAETGKLMQRPQPPCSSTLPNRGMHRKRYPITKATFLDAHHILRWASALAWNGENLFSPSSVKRRT
jgi:hypothetical protein